MSHEEIQQQERASDWALAMFMSRIHEYDARMEARKKKGEIMTFEKQPGTKEGPRRDTSNA